MKDHSDQLSRIAEEGEDITKQGETLGKFAASWPFFVIEVILYVCAVFDAVLELGKPNFKYALMVAVLAALAMIYHVVCAFRELDLLADYERRKNRLFGELRRKAVSLGVDDFWP